jgi:DNA-3-methyladenine glycosylase I
MGHYCRWCENDPLLIAYHDKEWGQREDDDQRLFEAMCLELFQSGLSWKTVLHKRDSLRKAFRHFELEKVATMNEQDVERLLKDSGIIRHRKKIEATIQNSRNVVRLQREFGSFREWIESLPNDVEAKAAKISEMFTYMGPITAKSFLEATGFIPVEHDEQCHLFEGKSLQIKPIGKADRDEVQQFFHQHWGSPEMVLSTGVFHCERLPGFLYRNKLGEIIGLITYVTHEKRSIEIISLDSVKEGKGIGTSLLQAVEAKAIEQHVRQIEVITTNDNLHALGFYQKRGYQLKELVVNGVEKARQLKPSIPRKSADGIPIRDELKLVKTMR